MERSARIPVIPASLSHYDQMLRVLSPQRRCGARPTWAPAALPGDAFPSTPGDLHFPELSLHEIRERAGRRLRRSARRKHDIDVRRSHLPIGQHAHQSARFQFVYHGEISCRKNAEPCHSPSNGCIRAVQDKSSLDAHCAGDSVAPKRPSLHDSAGRADDSRVIRKIARGRRSSGPRQVRGRCNDDSVHCSDFAGNGRGIAKHANADSDVDRFADKILPIIIEDEFHAQTSVLIGETRQMRQDTPYCEAGGCGDAQ